ncbi:MAG: hypothetical protein ABIF10_05855 [Candidatus Woesearchaeota archaeon]
MAEDIVRVAGDKVHIEVNPCLYTLETIYAASYVFLDRAYVLLDGDPKKSVVVSLKPKSKVDLARLGLEFMNELLNYADYERRARETRTLRETILQRALMTNDPTLCDDDVLANPSDDPKSIMLPWEARNDNQAK